MSFEVGTFYDESNRLFVFVQEAEPAAGFDDLVSFGPDHPRLGEALVLELEHGRATGADFGVAEAHGEARRLGLPQ